MADVSPHQAMIRHSFRIKSTSSYIQLQQSGDERRHPTDRSIPLCTLLIIIIITIVKIALFPHFFIFVVCLCFSTFDDVVVTQAQRIARTAQSALHTTNSQVQASEVRATKSKRDNASKQTELARAGMSTSIITQLAVLSKRMKTARRIFFIYIS